MGDVVGATWKGITTVRSKVSDRKEATHAKDALQTIRLADFERNKYNVSLINLTSKELG